MVRSKKLKFSRNIFPKLGRTWQLFFAVVIALVLTLNFSRVATAAAKHYTDLQFNSLPGIKLPKYERFQLNNGLVVYLMEDHELPLVSGTTLIKTGSRWEAGDKVGLGDVVGSLMRIGGTNKHSPDELNEILEQRAASVETDINESTGTASFESLTEDLETVFGLFAEVLREPAFAPEKLELIKTQIKGSIARRNDDSDNIASREFRKLIYGQNSPYARTIEYATLDKIQREDVINFYRKYFHPNNIILGIV